VNQLNSMSQQSPRNHPDVRSRRLMFRSWHRGTQEGDLIFGPFAEICLPVFDTSQLDQFEALLDCTDPDLFDWIVAGISPPTQHDHDVMRMLRNFCARTNQTREHKGN
jgi:antitoxin CptB